MRTLTKEERQELTAKIAMLNIQTDAIAVELTDLKDDFTYSYLIGATALLEKALLNLNIKRRED